MTRGCQDFDAGCDGVLVFEVDAKLLGIAIGVDVAVDGRHWAGCGYGMS